MAKKCNKPDCNYNQFGGGYCKLHQSMREDGKAPKKIKPFTQKRSVVNRQYQKESRQYLKEHPFCTVNSPVCMRIAQGIQHKKGKASIELLMDKRFWKPSCNPCNLYIEENVAWALENDHALSRHCL